MRSSSLVRIGRGDLKVTSDGWVGWVKLLVAAGNVVGNATSSSPSTFGASPNGPKTTPPVTIMLGHRYRVPGGCVEHWTGAQRRLFPRNFRRRGPGTSTRTTKSAPCRPDATGDRPGTSALLSGSLETHLTGQVVGTSVGWLRWEISTLLPIWKLSPRTRRRSRRTSVAFDRRY